MLIKRKLGSPKWVLKYQCPRTLQKRSMPIGGYPEVSLHEARQIGMQIIRQEYGSDQFELIQPPVGVGGAGGAGGSGGGDRGEARVEGRGAGGRANGKANGQGSEISSPDGELSPTAPTLLVPEALGKMSHLEVFADEEAQDDLKPVVLNAGVQAIESAKLAPTSQPNAFGSGRIKAFITLNQFHLDHYLPYIMVAKRSWGTDVSVLKNHILPMLGGYAMLDLKPFVIQEMVQALVKKGLSPSTCNRALIILRFMYNCGLRWEVLPKMENPCKNVKELALNNKKERFLNGNEISTLKLELSKSKNKFLPYIVQLLILTGCRRGEALNAQIQHFDLGRGDWVVPLPKAGKARHIPLNDLAIQTVRTAILFKQSQNQVAKESHFLFPNPATGQPFQQIFYSWDKARKAAHIDTVRMHDLRHSFASAMVNSGMTLYDVKEILGHSNIRTTERYAHLSNSRLRQAAGAVTTYYENQDWIGDEPELVSEE
jgi:site-specific recombinase XerD